MLISFLIPLVVGFLLLTLVMLTYRTARSIALSAQENNITAIADMAANKIERLWIRPRNHSVKVLANSETFRRRLRGEAEFTELFAEWQHTYNVVDGYFFIYYGLADGTVELYPDLELPPDFDPRIRPWYIAGMSSTGMPVWSEPYAEIITGKPIISTTLPILNEAGERIGVFAVDMTFDHLDDALADIPRPENATVYLVDSAGAPFAGSDTSYQELNGLPQGTDDLLVHTTAPMENGWRIAVVTPQVDLIQGFDEAALPLISVAGAAFLILFGSVSFALMRLGSRARRLAAYFGEAMEGSDQLRSIFTRADEFSYLNHRFNEALHKARRSEAERLAQERSYRQLVERVSIGFFKTTGTGKLTYANAYCARIFGYTPEELSTLPSALPLYMDPADRQTFLKELIRNGELHDRRVKMRKKDGEPIWVSVTAVVDQADTSGSDYEVHGFMVDATHQVVEHRRLTEYANTDPLTGLLNRRALEHMYREQTPKYDCCSLVFFDIDNFKGLNDTYGHEAGDRILKHIAQVGSSVLRVDDVFARYGGDEFAILLANAEQDTAIALARRLQAAVRSAPLPDGVPYVPTLSVGVAVQNEKQCPLDEIVIRADRELYRSKAAGGDTAHHAEPV